MRSRLSIILVLLALLSIAVGAAVPLELQAAAPPVPATGWLLDEGAGSALSEWGGWRTGVLGGPTLPTWSSNTPFAYPGNYSLSFVPSGGGAGNYARLQGHTSSTRGTLSFWASDLGTSGLTRYMLDSSDGGRNLAYRGGTGPSNVSLYLNQSFVGAVDTSLMPLDGSWNHVAIVWDNALATDKQKVYKNGVQVASFNVTLGAVNPANVYLGSRFSLNEAWNGRIDEYALWNKPLAPDEVAWLATHSLNQIPTVRPERPTAAWLFDEGAGGDGTITRDSVGVNNGTLRSNVGWTTSTPHPYAGNRALYFDGTIDNRVNFGSVTYGPQGSIQVWAYRNGGAQYLMDASPGGRTLLYGQYQLFMNDSFLGALASDLIPDGEWTQLVFTWDNSLATDKEKVYKNGALFATFNTTLNTVSPAMLWLGNRYSNNEPWRGYIDDYALWNTALTPENVGWLYQHSLANLIPEPTSVVLLGLGGLGLLLAIARKRRST